MSVSSRYRIPMKKVKAVNASEPSIKDEVSKVVAEGPTEDSLFGKYLHSLKNPHQKKKIENHIIKHYGAKACRHFTSAASDYDTGKNSSGWRSYGKFLGHVKDSNVKEG